MGSVERTKMKNAVNNANVAGEGRNGDHWLSKFSAVASYCLSKCHGAIWGPCFFWDLILYQI